MALKHHCLFFFAVIAFLNCQEIETRGVRPFEPSNVNKNELDSLFNHPGVRIQFLDFILQSRGTSVKQIHDRIAAAGGDLNLIVKEVNAEVKAEIIRIEENVIKINPIELKALLREALQLSIREKLSDNPAAASVLEQSLDNQIADQSQQLDEVVENSAIPLETARKFLEVHSVSKRSLQPRDFNLNQIIQDTIVNLLHSQLSGVVWDLLENLKNTLLQLRINSAPADDFGQVISYAVNTLVNRGVELITTIQETIRPSGNTTTASPVSRRRRAADDGTSDGTDNGGTDNGGTDNGSTDNGSADNGGDNAAVGGGLLDILIRPLMNLLALLLSPLRLLLKGLVNGLLALLNPILGEVLTSGLSNTLNNILDMLFPSFPV